jgi:hypothetical protein
MAGVRFLTNEARKPEGLAYAGFETFKGSPYTSCARETGQNSRDAAAGSGTVRVSFDLLTLARKEIPFADELEHSIACCLASPFDEKTKAFLTRAQKAITSDSIKVLKIADMNTTGLTGPVDDSNSVFNALVKGDGITNKSDPTSAGSYGIGKNAAYAISELQSVVYTTRYRDKATDEEKFAAQGRLRLISHRNGDTDFSAEGYWGAPDFCAIEDESEVPPWMRREERGTSIFAVGFSEEENWLDRMTLSLVTNFFLAIDRQEIEFSLQEGKLRLNPSTLDHILDSPQIRQSAEDKDESAQLERSKKLLQCVRSDATATFAISVDGLGEFTLRLLIGDELPREIHVLRNGIYITDNFAKFGEPLRRFPGARPFIAILEPSRSDKGKLPSALLKQLENPAHDAFEPERIIDSKGQKNAKSQIKQLIKKVREVIKTAAKIDDLDEAQLEELSHLFASGDAGNGSSETNKELDPDRYKYGTAEPKRRTPPPPGVGNRGQSRRRRGPYTDPAPPTPPQPRPVHQKNASGSRLSLSLDDVRTVLPNEKDLRYRTIFFTPKATVEAEIEVYASGLSDGVSLQVDAQASGIVRGGRPLVGLVEGERFRLELVFSEPYDGPVEVSATGVSASSQSEEAK